MATRGLPAYGAVAALPLEDVNEVVAVFRVCRVLGHPGHAALGVEVVHGHLARVGTSAVKLACHG